MAKLVQEAHTSGGQEYDSLQSLIDSTERQKRKITTQLDNIVEAISDCSDKSVRQVLQQKIPDLETKRISLEKKVQELRWQIKKYDKKVVDLSAAFSLLRAFRKQMDKQPLSVQSQILSHIIKEIIVHEDRIVLKIYGAGDLVAKHEKSRLKGDPQGGSHVDTGSYRIRYGGR